MRVVIEHVQFISGTAYVIARVRDHSFVLGDNATLGGVPIKEWVGQPRKLLPDGSQDKDAFAFALKNPEHIRMLVVGSPVELCPA